MPAKLSARGRAHVVARFSTSKTVKKGAKMQKSKRGAPVTRGKNVEDTPVRDVEFEGEDAGSGELHNDTTGAVGSSNNIVSAGGLGSLSRHRCLVLDSAFRPINVVTWIRAINMQLADKLDVLEHYDAYAASQCSVYPLIAVARVRTFVDVQEVAGRVSLSRRNLMVRDKFTCQYCGCTAGRALTLDHVVPVSRGGRSTWDNLVTACAACNQRKASHTLKQLGWRLAVEPREPSPYEVGLLSCMSQADIERPPPEWEAYVTPFREKVEESRLARLAGCNATLED